MVQNATGVNEYVCETIKPVCLVQTVTYSGMTRNKIAEEEHFHVTSGFMDLCHHLRRLTKVIGHLAYLCNKDL